MTIRNLPSNLEKALGPFSRKFFKIDGAVGYDGKSCHWNIYTQISEDSEFAQLNIGYCNCHSGPCP